MKVEQGLTEKLEKIVMKLTQNLIEQLEQLRMRSNCYIDTAERIPKSDHYPFYIGAQTINTPAEFFSYYKAKCDKRFALVDNGIDAYIDAQILQFRKHSNVMIVQQEQIQKLAQILMKYNCYIDALAASESDHYPFNIGAQTINTSVEFLSYNKAECDKRFPGIITGFDDAINTFVDTETLIFNKASNAMKVKQDQTGKLEQILMRSDCYIDAAERIPKSDHYPFNIGAQTINTPAEFFSYNKAECDKRFPGIITEPEPDDSINAYIDAQIARFSKPYHEDL